jgi:peptidoglycan hydrolase-like protein with peptidoglycan-binding domain
LIDAIVSHSGGYKVPKPIPEPTNPPVIPDSAIWAMGATGYKVKQIQGIVGVNADGVFGPITKNAVAQWQSNLGLVADGIWGPRTEEATNNLFAFLVNLPMIEEVNPNNPFLEALANARNQIISVGSR